MPSTLEEQPLTEHQKAALISHYPREHRHVGRSVAIAIGIHLTLAALICVIAYWMGLTTLRDLLLHGGAIAESGPAPEEPMTVELQLEEVLPPPTPNPEFIQQVVKPKVVPPPPVKKPVVKPQPPKPRPRYTAPNAHGEGKTQNISVARVGDSGLPSPPYPYSARNAHQEGTVGMQVVFDGSGGVASADVVSSSGVVELDVSTRNFIFGHWKNPTLANQTIHVPVIYSLADPRGAH